MFYIVWDVTPVYHCGNYFLYLHTPLAHLLSTLLPDACRVVGRARPWEPVRPTEFLILCTSAHGVDFIVKVKRTWKDFKAWEWQTCLALRGRVGPLRVYGVELKQRRLSPWPWHCMLCHFPSELPIWTLGRCSPDVYELWGHFNTLFSTLGNWQSTQTFPCLFCKVVVIIIQQLAAR